jgi:hypothetical protein
VRAVKRFECPRCSGPLHFESRTCDSCASLLGYEPLQRTFLLPGSHTAPLRRLCANHAHAVCNWLVPEGSPDLYCVACRHNRIVPNLSWSENVALWRRIEAAKHRLFYGLLRFGLPLHTMQEDPERGLAFEFLSDLPGEPKVLTGHAGGVITLNIAEADDAQRERQRAELEEPYRTLLGHFRHEIAHYYWDRIIAPTPEQFRALFGDERADYSAALRVNYNQGPPADWRERHISAYASAHPWEDFAETWAHYLHMVDTLETASAFGVSLWSKGEHTAPIDAVISFDPYDPQIALETLIETWVPLTYALNSINRSMGQPDLYPFELSPMVIAKLAFVHALIHGADAMEDTALRAVIAGLNQPSAPVG